MSLPEGVHLIEVPTPFPVGNVNCYLIDGEPLTLIDTGLRSSKSEKALRQGLEKRGALFADIEQILLTHGHIDHTGLAGQIARESNGACGVFVHEKDAFRIINHEKYMNERLAEYLRLGRISGVPQTKELDEYVKVIEPLFLKYGESVSNVTTFNEDVSLKTGFGDLHTIWVPGHSLGSVSYLSHKHQVAFTGDHILGNISSNPSLDFEETMGISMLRYLDSLDVIEQFSDYVALPGHRGIIPSLGERVSNLKEDYVTKIRHAKTVLTNEPLSFYEISRLIFHDYPVESMILALAETKDLMRILESRSLCRIQKKDGVYLASLR